MAYSQEGEPYGIHSLPFLFTLAILYSFQLSLRNSVMDSGKRAGALTV